MKLFGILLAAFAAHFISMEANNQQASGPTNRKIYVSPESLHLDSRGIFWHAKPNSWLPVNSISRDAQGIYLNVNAISWAYYVCRSCGWTYSHQPSQCENPNCNSTSFEVVYEDIWDR